MTPLAPSVRIWELNETSTRWDKMRAAPSDDQLQNMWIGWSALFSVASAFNLLVFLSVVLTKRAIASPFNKYLAVLMFPDIVMTGFCAVQCAFLVSYGGFVEMETCHFQSVYIIWSVAANSWLNGAIAMEICKLLRHSYERKRYFPPTTGRIVRVTAGCYCWSALLATSTLWGGFLPHSTDMANGLFCVPVVYDVTSELFFWLVFYPCMSGIPMAYSIYVTYKTLRDRMLPPPGKVRDLAVCFFRIVFVFLVVWLPTIIGVFATPGVFDIWVIYFASAWAHLQGALSALVILFKTDLKEAFVDLLKCRTWAKNREFVSSRRRSMARSWLAPELVQSENSRRPTTPTTISSAKDMPACGVSQIERDQIIDMAGSTTGNGQDTPESGSTHESDSPRELVETDQESNETGDVEMNG